MKKKAIIAFVLLLNLAGIACLVYFAVPLLTHDTAVRNPDAMIPFQEWEGSGWALTAGLLPLLGANAAEYWLLRSEKGRRQRFLLCFLPAVLCAALAAVYWTGSFIWWAT